MGSIIFTGKKMQQVKAMHSYPWSLKNGTIVYCSDGSFVVQYECTLVKYQDSDEWTEVYKTGTLNAGDIPNRAVATDLQVGLSVTSLGASLMYGCTSLSAV